MKARKKGRAGHANLHYAGQGEGSQERGGALYYEEKEHPHARGRKRKVSPSGIRWGDTQKKRGPFLRSGNSAREGALVHSYIRSHRFHGKSEEVAPKRREDSCLSGKDDGGLKKTYHLPFEQSLPGVNPLRGFRRECGDLGNKFGTS